MGRAIIFYFLLLFQVYLTCGQQPSADQHENVGEESFSIPAVLRPRKDLLPIANQHGIKNACDRNDCGDFHLAIYFLEDHSANLVVRRLDDVQWTFNLSIFISSATILFEHTFNHHYLEELIILGPSKHFEITKVINTTVKLYSDHRVHQQQAIPKTIIQTFSSREPHSIYQWMARKSFEELNPEYQLLMFNDKECRDFLKRHFYDYTLPIYPHSNHLLRLSLLDAYDQLISPTFKADVFRYAFLTLHGGCYFDHKMIDRKALRHVILPNDTFLVCSDALGMFGSAPLSLHHTQRLYNAVICSQAQEPRLWKTIDFVLRNIESRHQSGSDLSLTGPSAFYDAVRKDIKEENVRFSHGFQRLSLLKRRKYEDFFIKEKLTNDILLTKFYKGFHSDPQLRYGRLWQMGLVYYDLLLHHSPWKLYVFPGQTRCVNAVVSSSSPSNADVIILQPKTMLTQQELLYQEEGTSLCRILHLQIVQDETSEVWTMDISSSDVINGKGDYRIPFHVTTH